MALTNNTTTNERPEAKQLRANIQAEQDRRRAQEAAVTRAHQNASGPSFGASQEPQERMSKPRISKPGGG